jgi:hypothetical protein
MVDLALLQSVSYIAGALGVCVAASYYVMNLRITQKNQELTLKAQQQTLETRRISTTQEIMRYATNPEVLKNFFETSLYEWSDYEDFERKYHSGLNPEEAAKIFQLWSIWSSMGSMMRKGVIKVEDIYDQSTGLIYHWEKFKPIIEEYRKRWGGPIFLRDFEYVVGELRKYKEVNNPV